MQIHLAIVLAALSSGQSLVPAVRAQTVDAIEPAVQQSPAFSPLAKELKSGLSRLPEAKSKVQQKAIDDITTYYEGRDFEPVWWEAGKPTRQALAIAEVIAGARRDGLDPAHYPLPDMTSAADRGEPAVVESDLALTRAVVRYVTHLSAGRVNPRSLSRHVTPAPVRPQVASLLTRLSSASDIRAALRSYEPVHKQYWLMKNKLAGLLAEAGETDLPAVPDGKALRLGDRGQRVALLKQRLGLTDRNTDPLSFDNATLDAVRMFQRQNGLAADGIVGSATLTVLNRDSRRSLIALILANIERWRWMPRDLGTFYVAVNIPEYRLRVMDAGEEIHTTRVIVGKRRNPTPVFSDEIEHIIVNPLLEHSGFYPQSTR